MRAYQHISSIFYSCHVYKALCSRIVEYNRLVHQFTDIPCSYNATVLIDITKSCQSLKDNNNNNDLFFHGTCSSAGTILTALVWVIMMVFSGLLVNLKSIASWLQWIKYVSIFSYAMNVSTYHGRFI